MIETFKRSSVIPIGSVRRTWEDAEGLHIDWVPNAASNGCTWHPGGCDHSAQSQWSWCVQYAKEKAEETGRKYYVRAFRKSISHVGAWSYGVYDEPFPPIDRDWSADYGV